MKKLEGDDVLRRNLGENLVPIMGGKQQEQIALMCLLSVKSCLQLGLHLHLRVKDRGVTREN